jgi:hypothetical protein
MSLPKLVLPPSVSRYSVTFGNENVTVQLDGGLPRIRRDISGACHTVVCAWQLTVETYATMLTFYNTTILHGSLPFLIDLIIDTAVPTEYQASFVPETFTLADQAGSAYTVTATLKVVAAN